MAIATYSDLQQTIADWLNRADLDQQIPDFIQLAESTLNDVLRSSYMVSSATVSLSSGRATLPTDALEIIYTQVEDTPSQPLEQITPQQLVMLRRARTRAAAAPKFYAVIGREIAVTPSPDSAVSLDVDYYEQIPALSDVNTSNWLLDEAPHVYLYTSLLHATPFLMDDARYQVFNNAVSQQVISAVRSSQTLSFDDMKSAGFSLTAPSDAGSSMANPLGTTVGGAGGGA